MSRSGNIARFSYLQVWRVYQGQMYGQITDPANMPAGATTHPLLIDNVLSSGGSAATRELATFYGPSFLGQLFLGVSGLSAFDIVLPTHYAALNALITDSLVDTTTLLGATISGNNNSNEELPQVGIALTAVYQSRDLGTDGENKYLTIVYPSGTMTPTAPAINVQGGQNPTTLTYQFAPSLIGKMPTGNAFGPNQKFKRNRTDFFYIVADNPYAFTTYKGDTGDTTYVTGWKPVSAAVTGGNTANLFTVDGVVTAPTSIVPATGVVTPASVVLSSMYSSMYQSKFEAI